MIRDLAKSAVSFSWALSLLGVKQAVNMVRPGQPGGGDLFAPMARVAVDQLDDSMKGIYQSGDTLQKKAIDLAFAWGNPAHWLNPNQWMRPLGGCGQQGQAGFTQATEEISQAVNRIASGLTKAVGQVTSGIAQAAAMAGPGTAKQGAGTPSAPGNVPVSDEGAAAGWGPMPGDS